MIKVESAHCRKSGIQINTAKHETFLSFNILLWHVNISSIFLVFFFLLFSPFHLINTCKTSDWKITRELILGRVAENKVPFTVAFNSAIVFIKIISPS